MTTAHVRTFEVPTPLGTLRAASTGRGLAILAFPGSDFDGPLSALARCTGAAPVPDGAHGAVATQLDEWFRGRRRAFDLPLDDRLSTGGFTQDVLRALREVPFGALVTYGELARTVGRPGAARAVGRAVGSNPLPIVVP